jgi:predicted signal transduction protein with EAL and GGDEF domain
LLSVIKAPMEAFGNESLVSASFGVAIYPVDAQDQQGLLTHADSAMYRAKDSTESRVVFYRPPASEVPVLNRGADLNAAIDAAASALPATDAPYN